MTTKKEKPKFTFSKRDQADGQANPTMNKLEEEFAEIAAQKRKAKKMMSLIVGGVIAAVILIVAAIFLALASVEVSRKKKEAAAIVKMQEASNAAIVDSMTKARKFVASIKESEPQALKYANDAKEAAVSAIGEEVRAALVPAEPVFQVPTFGEEAAEVPAVASTNANKVADKAEKKAEKKEAAEKKKPQQLQLVDEGNDEIKAKYPVVKAVRGMYLEAYRVKYAALLATAMFSEIEKLALRAEKLTAPEKAKELVELANTIAEKVKTMGYTRELTEVARNVSGLKKTLDSVRADVASLAAVKLQEAMEREKVQKREAEEAKKRKEAEELAAKTKADCDKIAEVETTNIPLLKALRFHDAMRNLNLTAGELTTKGGTDALDIAKERVRRIEEVIKHLLNKVQGYKSPKGWMIEAADMKTLTVSSKKITWSDVFNTRMEVVNELLNSLVLNPEMTKSMRVRERTRLEVGTAICLWMYYRDVPTAVERAKQIATKASQEFAADAELTKQLMPGMVE